MEIHARKLLVHGYCADFNVRGGLKLQLLIQESIGDFYAPCASALLFLKTSTLQ